MEIVLFCCSNACQASPIYWGILFIKIIILLFFSILFIQSGLDKVKNYQENLLWLISFFKQSIFKGKELILLYTLTFFELLAGVLSFGSIPLLIIGNNLIGLIALAFAAISLLSVFLGQRVAKDYVGATGTTTYLLFTLGSMLVFILL